jgi:hypothetical protein
MTDAARMRLLEEHNSISAERFDSLEARLNSLAEGTSRMESLLQSVLTARTADAVTYANITALQSEVVSDKNELATLTSPSPTGLARLRSSALSLASTTKRTALTLLNDDVRRFRGKDSTKFSIPALFSPDLHPHVTKRHSTGPSARPNMPKRRSPGDDDEATTTPHHDNESVAGSASTKARKRRAEQAVQHGIDMIKIRLDIDDAAHSVAASQAPDSPLVDDDLDDLSIEDASVECMEDRTDRAEINQIDCDMDAISKHIDTLKRPESTARPEAIIHLQDMIGRLVIRRNELEHGTRRFSEAVDATPSATNPPPTLVPDPAATRPPRTHDVHGNHLSARGYPITSWSQGNQNNIDIRSPRPSPNHRVARQGGYGGGDDDDGDDNDGNGDDHRDNNYRGGGSDRGGRRDSIPSGRSSRETFRGGRGPGRPQADKEAWEASRFTSPAPFLPMDPNHESALRIQQTSVTLHYPAPPPDATGDG